MVPVTIRDDFPVGSAAARALHIGPDLATVMQLREAAGTAGAPRLLQRRRGSRRGGVPQASLAAGHAIGKRGHW